MKCKLIDAVASYRKVQACHIFYESTDKSYVSETANYFGGVSHPFYVDSWFNVIFHGKLSLSDSLN